MHQLYSNGKRFSSDIDSFLNVAKNDSLSETDLRVFLVLCTQLSSKRAAKIDKERLADTIGVSKKKVKESIETLVDMGIIEHAESDAVSKGYIFAYGNGDDED